MRVTVEMSLYPLAPQPIDKILAFIDTVRTDARLEVVVNQLSTQVRGELHDVMSVLTAAIERDDLGPGQIEARAQRGDGVLGRSEEDDAHRERGRGARRPRRSRRRWPRRR